MPLRHNPFRLLILLALIGLTTAACNQVHYRGADAAPTGSESPFDRTVTFKLAHAFYDDPPRCAFILPAKTSPRDRARVRMVEPALARHLSFRLERVIDPDRRDRLSRSLAIDPATPGGRRRFATATNCRAAVEVSTKGMETTYALVWAHAKLDIAVRMVRVRDNADLWHARHAASRSEGSLPLSPVGISVGAFSAGRFHSDQDVFPSMADDVARRIAKSLPEIRGAFASRSRNR